MLYLRSKSGNYKQCFTSEPKVLVRNRRHTTGDIESSDDTLDTSGEEDNKDVSTFRDNLSSVEQ